ncbi:hypothetical protein [Bradyrhizobium arachidis]|nr:hypothetical protein [Bradyrhizobium arachidis]
MTMGGMMAGAFALLGIAGALATMLIVALAANDIVHLLARTCG